MRKKGFTLIELLAAIVILSLLMITAVPSTINLLDRNKKQKDIANAKKLISFAETYMRKNNVVYPQDNQFLVLGYDMLNDGSLDTDSDGKKYSSDNSFVAIKKKAEDSNYTYDFYVQLVNVENYGVTLSLSSELDGENKFKTITKDVPNNDCSKEGGIIKCPNISTKLFNGNSSYEAISLNKGSKYNLQKATAYCEKGYIDIGTGCLTYIDSTISSMYCPSGHYPQYPTYSDDYCYANKMPNKKNVTEEIFLKYGDTPNYRNAELIADSSDDAGKICSNICKNSSDKESCSIKNYRMVSSDGQSGYITTKPCTYSSYACYAMCSYVDTGCDGYMYNGDCYTDRAPVNRTYTCPTGYKLAADKKCEKTAEYLYKCNENEELIGVKCRRKE